MLVQYKPYCACSSKKSCLLHPQGQRTNYEEKQLLKQDREDKEKAKHEPVGVVKYKGNTAVLKQPHLR